MLHLEDLTVGQVSGMIAAAIFVLQVLLPLVLPLVMLGLVRRGGKVEASEGAWSVIARFLHSSLWPTILQTHSSAAFSTPLPVLFVSLLRPLVIALVGVAAIVTPLGLYETIAPVKVPTRQPFHYIEDTSPIGLGTPPRTNTSYSRLCGWVGYMACPHSGNNITRITNSTGVYTTYNSFSTKIPAHLIEGFQSGLSSFSASVSSIFDIQYRSITTRTDVDDKIINNGTAYNVGAYRPLSTLLLSDEIAVYEGLIVDMKNGGLGFRNHTAPPWTKYGSTWDEDILFIEPESVCVDTNLTLDFDIPTTAVSIGREEANMVLTDRGGFVNINRTYPRWDRMDSQEHPQLWLRAYKAAFVNNYLTMAFMNVTNLGNPDEKAFRYLNSSVGREFSLHWKNGETAADFLRVKASSLKFSTSFGGYLIGTDEGKSNYTGFNSSAGGDAPLGEQPLYLNPFDIQTTTSGLFSRRNTTSFADAGLLCSGAGGSDLANITNMVASCGLLYGAPRRLTGSSLLFDPGSSWTLPLFSCISTVKASLKTVSFRFNGTDSLSGLSITNLTPKAYADESSKPLWGVENSGDDLADVKPLWGLVTPAVAKRLNLSTIQSEKLYIPGYTSGDLSSNSGQNLPAVDFPAMALGKVYTAGSDSGGGGDIDYSGATNLAMYRLWQELSRSAETAYRIPNLIWTDIAANLVLGTRSLAGGKGDGTLGKREEGGEVGEVPLVTTYERRIRYRYVYGIPAFLALALASLILISSFLLAVLGPARIGFLRVVLEETSVGRLLVAGEKGAGEGQVFTLGAEGWGRGRGEVNIKEGVGKGGAEVKYHRVEGTDVEERGR